MRGKFGRSLVAAVVLAWSASLVGCIDIIQEGAVGAAGSVSEAFFVNLFEGLLATFVGGS